MQFLTLAGQLEINKGFIVLIYCFQPQIFTIFVTVNGIGPLGGGEGVQLKSVKSFTFVTKIEISNILLSILKE